SCRWCWRSPDCPPSSCGDGNAALRFALGQPVCSRHLGFGGGLLLGHLLGTPPPERGRSTAQRSGGGRDPRPLPPLFKGRESIAARSMCIVPPSLSPLWQVPNTRGTFDRARPRAVQQIFRRSREVALVRK